MKSQIALIGIGLLIAAGVAYAELKPANNTLNAPVVSTTPAPAPSPAATKAATKTKTPATKKSTPAKIASPKVSKPTVSGGGGDDEDDGERGEHEGGDDD
jgi:hypothetical protein